VNPVRRHFSASIGLTLVVVAALAAAGESAAVASPATTATALKITSVSPASTSVGKSITITGTGFSKVSRVQLHSVLLPYKVVSATHITATIAAGSTTGPVTAYAASAQASSPKPLVVIPLIAKVTSISPTSGPLHTVVTVNGTGFTAPATVSFNGASTAATVVSATKLTVGVPKGSSTGPVTVTSAGSTVSAGTFTVTASIVLSTTGGPPTTTTNIDGSGFGANELVDLYYGLTDVALVATNSAGVFYYPGFVVPASAQPGTQWISAQGRHSGLGAQASFLVRTDWPEFGYKAAGGGFNPFENTLSPSTVGGLGQAWTWSTYPDTPSQVAVVGGIAYVHPWQSTVGLAALDATTGAVKWTAPAAVGGLGSSPAVVGGIVYVGADNGNVYALNASTGATVWTYPTGTMIESSPVVANGIVYIGSNNDTLYALNAATGAFVWSKTTGGEILSAPVVANGDVYVGSEDGTLYAYNAATGTGQWTQGLPGEIVASPVVYNGVIYVGDNMGDFYAFASLTGDADWNVTLLDTVEGAPAAANGAVYVGDSFGDLYSYNATDGALNWSDEHLGVISGVSIANGVLYVASGDGLVYAFGASDGGLLWSYTGGSAFSLEAPTVVNGTLYVNDFFGITRAFTLAGGLSSTSDARPALNKLTPNSALKVRS
jgi:outer membrane protein assembly factor BamB